MTTAPSPETAALGAIQRRVVFVLAAAQIFGGVGTAAGAAVGALLAADLSSDAFSGLASAASVVGAALIAIPVSRVMDVRGRRPGLLLAYAIGIIGALTIVIGASLHFFPLALLGLIATGGGTTATLQSRYAAPTWPRRSDAADRCRRSSGQLRSARCSARTWRDPMGRIRRVRSGFRSSPVHIF